MLALRPPADSQLPEKIYNLQLNRHHQASFRKAGLPHAPLMHSLCQNNDYILHKCPTSVEENCLLSMKWVLAPSYGHYEDSNATFMYK